jgi:hypothetical protein
LGLKRTRHSSADPAQPLDRAAQLVRVHARVALRRVEVLVAEELLDLAQAYYASYPEEIDEKIADNRRPLSELRELYPFAGFTFAGADE